MFSIDGIVSGFDTTSIIESLVQFQQAEIDIFNERKARIVSRQSAFGGIEAQLLTLRNALGKLNRTSSVFDARVASSSNEDVITATADSSAAAGSYQLTVTALAKAEQRASQGFSSENDLVGTGDITIQVGSNSPTTIQIDESNNSLSGLATAINEQSDDVSAGIIFDQSSNEYRLLLTSAETGATNTINVTSNLSGGTSPDFSSVVESAADASITLGSGPGAIVASFSTNQVDELITGVTLDLKSVETDQPVTIAITEDTSATVEAVEDFVDAFNSVVDFIDRQTAFDPETQFASPLTGNRNVNSIRDNLLTSVIENVDGLELGLSRLADIGVDIDTQGKLELDKSRLEDALAGNIDGIDPSDIRNLFGLNASSTNQGIEYLTGSDLTAATGEPIQVELLQAAEQATVTATSTIANSVVIDSSNNTFTISVDGQESETLTLAEGTYTQVELAELVQNAINDSEELGNRNVTVGVENDALTISTESYGLDSEISSISGNAAAALGFDGTESDNGVDVVGQFIVNGQVETAVGNGRVLIGESENENTADLQVIVTLTPDQIDLSGPEGELRVTRGITSQLDQYLNDVLDSEDGTLKIINDEFDAQIESIDASIERINEITEARRQSLIAEFTALESILADLQNTGNILSSQLVGLQNAAG